MMKFEVMKLQRAHRHDVELLALVGLLLAATTGLLAEGVGGAAQGGSGWRRIDTAAVHSHIQSGTLSDREARWYEPASMPR